MPVGIGIMKIYTLPLIPLEPFREGSSPISFIHSAQPLIRSRG